MPAADLPQSVDEEPAVCVRLSNKLVPYLLGLLEMYRWEDKLKGTPQEVVDGLGLFQDLLIALTEGNCTGDNMAFKLRQNPLNACQLQQSFDGGQTWTLAYDYSKCTTPAVTEQRTDNVLTITELVSMYGTNIPEDAIKPNAKDRPAAIVKAMGICAAALVVAESFTLLIDKAIEQSQDDWWGWLGAGLEIAAAALAFAGGPITIAGIVLGKAAVGLAATGLGVGAAISTYTALQDTGNPLSPEEKDNFVCCLQTALKNSFTYDSFRNFSCAGVRPEVMVAWREIATPEAWAGVVIAVNDAGAASADGLCCNENCQYIAPAAAVTIGTNTTRVGAILIDNDNNPPTGEAIVKAIYAVYELPEARIVTGVSLDAYILPYSQVGSLHISLSFPTQAGMSGGSVAVQSGHQSYSLSVANPNGYAVTRFALTIQVARAASNQIANWNNAVGELRAIKYCYSV